MQIQRQTATNVYSSIAFRLVCFKSKRTKDLNVFTAFVTEFSAVAVNINRKDAANILRRIRKEKQFIA